jgi:hypothetical protein
LTAFRRKNALHGIHVGTPKLIPIATSSHTKHRLLSVVDIDHMKNLISVSDFLRFFPMNNRRLIKFVQINVENQCHLSGIYGMCLI